MISLDLYTIWELGYLFTNQRDIQKASFVMPPDSPLTWVSKYGSVTFDQVGKEFPFGGMNEKGLVVEQMFLPETIYPERDERPAIGELQFIQYLLDTCATVAEVLEHIQTIRIPTTSFSTIHYLVCDASGDVATLEYLKGALQIHHGEQISVPLLSNCSYAESLYYLNSKEHLIPQIQSDYHRNALERFIKGATYLRSLRNQPLSIQDAFQALEEVKREDTVWSVVYDVTYRDIYFKTKQHVDIKRIKLDQLSWDSNHNSLALHLNQSLSGPIHSYFEPYNYSLNRKLVGSIFQDPTFMQIFQSEFTDEMLDFYASYPDRCVKL